MSATKKFVIEKKDLIVRLLSFAIGFSPIGALCLSTFNLLPLHISGPLVVAPAVAVLIAMIFLLKDYRQSLIRGHLLGMFAVMIYDLTCRFPFLKDNLWEDFIPKIGNYLLHQEHVHWSVGYLWRYLGNGGGMGLAFYMISPFLIKKLSAIKAGIVYGLSIFICLIITIKCSPSGETYLFKPSAISLFLGFAGHVVYGSVLGLGVYLEQNFAFLKKEELSKALHWSESLSML